MATSGGILADLQMRPRFALDVSCDPEILVAVLEENATRAEPPLEGHFDPQHCVVQHQWSSSVRAVRLRRRRPSNASTATPAVKMTVVSPSVS